MWGTDTGLTSSGVLRRKSEIERYMYMYIVKVKEIFSSRDGLYSAELVALQYGGVGDHTGILGSHFKILQNISAISYQYR